MNPAVPTRPLRLDVVIPVYNEAHVLAHSIGRLSQFLAAEMGDYDWRVVVANNASTDATLAEAERLAAGNERVSVLHLDQKGRGRALKRAWLESDADILSYMDVDLSTHLRHLRELAGAIARGECEIAIGNRLSREALTKRSLRRELISRSYNVIVRTGFGSRVVDAQCGFKAISRSAAQALIPDVADTQWFFDTELLLLAESRGYVICQIPVEWTEDPDSRVKIVKTAMDDLKGLWRLRRSGVKRTTVRPASQRAAERTSQ